MTGLLTIGAAAILLGWTAFALTGLVADARAAMLAAAVCAACALILRDTQALRGAVAVLAPFGVMLPALALRDVASKMGVPALPFTPWELAGFLLAYGAFLAAAFGVIPVDMYRLGYAPLPVAVMVLALCAWGLVTGNWFLPLVAVIGQLGWVMGWGSSNWFDYVLHVLMIPVAVVALLGRLIGGG